MRWNDLTAAKYARLKRAMLIDHELTIEDGELTPSMKLAPNIVAKVFKAEIESLYDSEEPIREDVFVINLGENQPDLSSADSGEVTLS
jgi:DNA-binding XRE family transcriptional regulator